MLSHSSGVVRIIGQNRCLDSLHISDGLLREIDILLVGWRFDLSTRRDVHVPLWRLQPCVLKCLCEILDVTGPSGKFEIQEILDRTGLESQVGYLDVAGEAIRREVIPR